MPVHAKNTPKRKITIVKSGNVDKKAVAASLAEIFKNRINLQQLSESSFFISSLKTPDVMGQASGNVNNARVGER